MGRRVSFWIGISSLHFLLALTTLVDYLFLSNTTVVVKSLLRFLLLVQPVELRSDYDQG